MGNSMMMDDSSMMEGMGHGMMDMMGNSMMNMMMSCPMMKMMMDDSDMMEGMGHGMMGMMGDSDMMGNSMMMDDSSMMEGMGHGMMNMMMSCPMMKMMMNHSSMIKGMEPGAMSAEMKDDHSAHQTMEMDTKEFKVKGEFQEQLQKAYDSYIGMKDAFVASDVEMIKNKADKLTSSLDKVDMGLLQGDAHMDWMKQIQKMNATVLSIRDADYIEEQRSSFAEFNNNFYQSIKKFGLHHGTVYYQYCPMAFGKKGAYWLSNIKEIKNPYLGEAMLSCGEIRETLKY
jgi:hypothetical protein